MTLIILGKMLKDHLHIRGEYISIDFPPVLVGGSSPHTWRILTVTVLFRPSLRIISTYVENTELSLHLLLIE